MTADGSLATDTPVTADAQMAVAAAARAARGAVADLAGVPGERLDEALAGIADQRGRRAGEVLAANEADVRSAQANGITGALLDRLRLDGARLEALAGQLPAPAPGPRHPAAR